jgi:hypothetical protein
MRAILLLLLGATHVVSAETVGVAPARDNSIFSTDPDAANGAGGAIFSGRTNGAGTRQRALLYFDVAAALPAGATVTSASLTLTLIQAAPGSGLQMHTLHALGATWGEGVSQGDSGMGAPAAPDDATWINRFWPDVFWSAEGGDFDATPLATASVGTGLGPYAWAAGPLAAEVQAWLDEPDCNFGWLLLGNESVLGTAKKFSSREADDPDTRPLLTVSFIPPCAGDLDRSGAVELDDLLALLGAWGPCSGCAADLDGSGAVDVLDLIWLLKGWGGC